MGLLPKTHDRVFTNTSRCCLAEQEAYLLHSSDALEDFFDFLELDICSIVLQKYMYLILLRFFAFTIFYMWINVLWASIRGPEVYLVADELLNSGNR